MLNKALKLKISRMFSCNYELNRKIICMKRSWDEVALIIGKGNCRKKCRKGCK